MFDWLAYEHKTVRAVRGSGRKSLEKLTNEGWELVSQESGALRNTIKVRRTRNRQGWFRLGGGAAAAAALVTVIAVGAVMEDDSTDHQNAREGNAASAPKDVPTTTPRPPEVASSLHPPMVWGHWKVVGDKINVGTDLYGSYDPDFEVVNTSAEKADGYFTVSFLRDGRVLGQASCTTNLSLASNQEVRPDAPGFVKCDSDDHLIRGWTEITIESGESYNY